MNKILFLSLALFVTETVSAEEGLQPYMLLVTVDRRLKIQMNPSQLQLKIPKTCSSRPGSNWSWLRMK